MWGLFGASKPATKSLIIPKYGGDDGINLETALQYGTSQPESSARVVIHLVQGMANGLVALQSFIQEYSLKVYQPAYADVTTLVDVGNTDGWMKVRFDSAK